VRPVPVNRQLRCVPADMAQCNSAVPGRLRFVLARFTIFPAALGCERQNGETSLISGVTNFRILAHESDTRYAIAIHSLGCPFPFSLRRSSRGTQKPAEPLPRPRSAFSGGPQQKRRGPRSGSRRSQRLSPRLGHIRPSSEAVPERTLGRNGETTGCNRG